MATDDAREYVLAFENNKPEAARIAASTAQKLQNGQTALIEVVKALGEYITDDDTKIRTRAVNYLTAIIQVLPPTYLNRQQIQVLNTFLISRIEDGGAVDGLSRLQGLSRYTKEMAQELAQTIFDQFSDGLRGVPQTGRFKLYSLMNELLGNHRKAIKEMGDKSFVGYVQVVAGEKDPRNLMLIFSMLRVLIIEWDISGHVDQVFDAVYAYFPITFRPPPNDPLGITAQDLKDRLRDCLAASGLLAPSVFPNLIERLDSTSENVKKDVLQGLAACAANYDPSVMSQYSITLWDAVKFEVLQAQEPFLADEALNVIKNIAACLSKSQSPHTPTADPLIQYLKPVNKECLEHLQEPASRQANASGDILKAAASASIQSFEGVLKTVGPALFTLQQSSEGIVNQRAILTVVNRLFEASIEVYGSWTNSSTKNPSRQLTLISEFKDKLLAIYSRALMSTVKEEVSYRLAATRGLLLLAQMSSLLGENETGLMVQHFNDIVLDEESYGRDELKQRAMQALAEISKFKPRLITDITFPKFIARLPDNEEQAAQSTDYRSVLEGLAEISSGKDLLETLIRRLLSKLEILLQDERKGQYAYTCAILSTILYVLRRSAKEPEVSFGDYMNRIVLPLSQKASVASLGPLLSDTVLDLLGRISNLIIRNSPTEQKDLAANNVYRLFKDAGMTEDMSPHTLQSITPSQENTLILSTWILAALPRGSRSGILSKPLIPLINVLEEIASSARQQPVVRACLKQIELIVNKHISSEQDLAKTKDMFSAATLSIGSQSNESTTGAEFEFKVRYTFSLVKALILRLVPQTAFYLNSLVDLLEQLNPPQARYVSLGFSALLAPCDIVCKDNEAQIRLLAPQRVFQTLVPLISTKFRDQQSSSSSSSSASDRKETYLIALSGILGTVSSDIVMPELPTLLPLLLQSLDISDANHTVKNATLDTLLVVITKNPTALIESGHIPALIRRLLIVATLAKKKKKLQQRPNQDFTAMDIDIDSGTAADHKNTQSTSTSTSKLNTKSTSQSVSTAQLGSDNNRSVTTNTSSNPKTRQLALRCIGLLPQHVADKTPNPLLPLKKPVLAGLVDVLDDPRRDVRKEAVDARAKWLRGVDEVDSDDEI